MTGRRQSGQFGHMDPVAPIRSARQDFSQEHDVSITFLHRDAVIADPFPQRFQLRHFMVMRCKKRSRPEMLSLVDVLGDRPGDAQAVIGARSASDLIQENQAMPAGAVEDLRGF